MTEVFYLNLLLLIYIYTGYPLLAWLLGHLRRMEPLQPTEDPGREQPTVTVLIAAYNEAAHIESTVRNKLSQNYPAEKLEVIVVSDESTDGTDHIVESIADVRVRLVRQQPRAGKTSGLNLIAPLARGEILIFSDANSHYSTETVAELVKTFADPNVGYVTGRMLYRAPDGSATGEGCSTYMRYENRLRAWETRLGSIVGVDGGVDAMRRELWRPMRPDQLPDFVAPLNVREQGRRVVYQPSALLYEDTLTESADEFRMRVRVSLRAWWALKDKAALLNPLRFGIFAWQLWSHKVLRYLAPFFQAFLLISNMILARHGGVWLVLLVMQGIFYGIALAAHWWRRSRLPGPINAIYYLCLLNLAGGLAFVQFLRGRKQVTWQPRT